MMKIEWYPAFRHEIIGVNENHNTVIQITPVTKLDGMIDGWDVWVINQYCGAYLTREMAKAAAIGLLNIAINGSSIERWQYGKLWGVEK